MTRMDRYKENDNSTKMSRLRKNEELYENVGNNTKFTNITDVTNANVTDISNSPTDYKTREDYQKLVQCGATPKIIPPVKKELDEFNNVYANHENKIYDINDFLEEARKNREEDQMEEKRKLKNTSYNILASMNIEELEKFRKEKQERITKGNDDLKELIDTIASKTLAGEIEVASDLLSDLMATSIIEKLDKDEKKEKENDNVKEFNDEIEEENEKTNDKTKSIKNLSTDEEDDDDDELEEDELSLSKNILDKNEIDEIKKIIETTEQDIQQEELHNEDETDFYTKTMDLTPNDFNADLEEEVEKKLPLSIKILILAIVIVVVAIVTIYFLK